MVFNEDSKLRSANLLFLYNMYLKVIVKKQKITTFVRFSDYYLNICLWRHTFQISLH